jgi:hypothetical protein
VDVVDVVGWVGLLTSTTGELILPGRDRRRPPAGSGFVVDQLKGRGATRFGVESIIQAALGAFAAGALYRFGATLDHDRKPRARHEKPWR